MLRSKDDSPLQATPSRIFAGVRFLLLGFHPGEEAGVRSKLLRGGGVDAGEYGPRCTHLIVDKIVYDDSECLVARNDGKTVVTALWVEHCLDVGMIVDTSSIMYRPVKDLNGIPGAKSMSICLTGYQRQDRDDIMRMVGLMGAYFSKPLVANKVTHLICYKFEGEKYELAKKLKKIKLVNHRWLEDCLRAWEILPESNYSKSGYELEMMEAEAKDSEEETEEDKNDKVFGGNVVGGPSNLHSGNGVTISNGSEISFPINKNEAAKKILSDKMQDIVNEKASVNSPKKAVGNDSLKLQEVNRNQEKLTGQVTPTYDRAIGTKENSGLFSNPIMARSALPSDAMTPNASSYSRKNSRRSPASKFAANLSSNMHGTPISISEPYNIKDGFDVSPPKLEQYKDNTDFGSIRNPGSDSKLQSEGGSTRPQKRKTSLSNVSSKSPRKDANSKNYATGSQSTRGNNVEVPISMPDIVSGSHGNDDNCVDKNDVQSSGSSQSASVPKIKSLDANSSLLNHGLTYFRSPVPDAIKFPSDLKMLDNAPETSGLAKFKSTVDTKNEDKEMCSLTHLQSGSIAAPGVGEQNTMVSSLKSENTENGKPASPVDLGADNGSKNKASRSLTKKKVVKKSLASKSKLSSGSSKQKGSLCLNNKSIFDNDMFSKEKGKEAEHGSTLGVGDDMADQAIPAEPVIENKVAENTSFNNKGVSDVAVVDDETEAPEEETGAELVNATSEEMSKLNPQANAASEMKLEVEPSTAMKTKKDIVRRKNSTVISENVEPTVLEKVEAVNSEKVEPKAAIGGTKNLVGAGSSILKEEVVKGKKNVSNKRKKNAAVVVKKTEKSGKGIVADFEKTIDDAKMGVKSKTSMQHPASKLKSKLICLGETEVPITRENDAKLVEKEDPMQGRSPASSKCKKTQQTDVKRSEVIAKNKMGKLAKGIDEETLETENAKEVQHPVIKPKSKTASAVKAQKRTEEEEKENKPVEAGSVVMNSGKPKESIGTKLKRALTQTSKAVLVTEEGQKKSGRASKVVEPEPMCFILSGHRLQRKEFQQLIKRMKGRVCRDSHNWSYEATHFVVPDPIRRTEKFFAAAASGRWILKTDYLTASNQEGKFLPEEPYEWFKKGFSEDGAINLEAPRKWRLLRERTGHGAFYGMRIIVYGECIAPPLDTLKRAVKAGGGVIVATAPPYTKYLKSGVDFAVVCPGMPCVDSWVQEFLRHEIPCISADYLVEYVCKPGCSLERHILFKTEAWADKSFANLVSRSEEIVEDLTSAEDDDGNDTSGSDDVSCQICGSRERAEIMLICGDETGSLGCGVGTHIDCCDPPLEAVPEEDWFCPKCIDVRNSTRPSKKAKKGSRSSKRK